MSGASDPGTREALEEALGAPGRAAAALAGQRGHLRLLGDTATVYPRLVVTGRGASLAAGRALVSAIRAADGEAEAIPSRDLLGRVRSHADGRTMLLVACTGEDLRAHALMAEASALLARPLVVAVVDRDGAEIGRAADVEIVTGAPADDGPPLEGPLATATVLAAVARMLTWGASAEIDDVIRLATEAAGEVEHATRALAGMPAERVAELASLLGGPGGLVVAGRAGGAAAADLAALAWWMNTGRPATAIDARDIDDGPREGAGPDLALLCLSPDRAAQAEDRALAADFVAAGSPVVWVGPHASAPRGAEAVVVPEIDPVLDPVVHAFVATVVGRRVAADRGRPVGRLVRPSA